MTAPNTTPIVPGTLRSFVVAFTPSDTTTAKSAYAPTGTNGARIDSICVTSTDTAARDLQLFLYKGGTSYLIGTVSIPAGAGNTSAVNPVELLAQSGNTGLIGLVAKDPYGNSVLWLDSSTTLYAAMGATITTAKQVTITGLAGEY
jgi:hypothetical protein